MRNRWKKDAGVYQQISQPLMIPRKCQGVDVVWNWRAVETRSGDWMSVVFSWTTSTRIHVLITETIFREISGVLFSIMGPAFDWRFWWALLMLFGRFVSLRLMDPARQAWTLLGWRGSSKESKKLNDCAVIYPDPLWTLSVVRFPTVIAPRGKLHWTQAIPLNGDLALAWLEVKSLGWVAIVLLTRAMS